MLRGAAGHALSMISAGSSDAPRSCPPSGGACASSFSAPCLRRVRTLEEQGFIRGYHADVNARELGFEVQVFAMVGLVSQAEVDLCAFEALCQAWPLVRECHMLNGEVDFVLKCVAPDLRSFQRFLTEELTSAPNVASVKTSLVIRGAKDEPGVPFDVLEARLAQQA